MMPAWHQLVSMSGHVEESETARKLQLYATSIYQVHSFVNSTIQPNLICRCNMWTSYSVSWWSLVKVSFLSYFYVSYYDIGVIFLAKTKGLLWNSQFPMKRTQQKTSKAKQLAKPWPNHKNSVFWNGALFIGMDHRPSRHGRSSSAKHKRNLVMIWNHVCLSPPVGLVSLNRVGFDIYSPIQKSITNR